MGGDGGGQAGLQGGGGGGQADLHGGGGGGEHLGSDFSQPPVK